MLTTFKCFGLPSSQSNCRESMKKIGVLSWLLSCALRDLGVSQDRFKDFRPGVVFDELHSKIIWGVLSNVPSAPMANAMMSERRNRIHPCLCVRGSPRAILARLNLYGITVIRVLLPRLLKPHRKWILGVPLQLQCCCRVLYSRENRNG